MKKLSDYKGEEAIELWADIIEPASVILASEDVANAVKQKKTYMQVAHVILKNNKAEVLEILKRIDPTMPVNGLTVVTSLMTLLSEIKSGDESDAFFNSQGQKIESVSSGSAMENTEDENL